MSLVSFPWNPDRKTLAEFSEAGMFVFGMLLAPLSLWRGKPNAAIAYWTLAVAMRLLGLINPSLLRPMFVAMSLVAWPIGWVTSHLALAIVYYGVFAPTALFFRTIGRDPLNRRLDRSARTYWEDHRRTDDLKRYLRQF